MFELDLLKHVSQIIEPSREGGIRDACGGIIPDNTPSLATLLASNGATGNRQSHGTIKRDCWGSLFVRRITHVLQRLDDVLVDLPVGSRAKSVEPNRNSCARILHSGRRFVGSQCASKSGNDDHGIDASSASNCRTSNRSMGRCRNLDAWSGFCTNSNPSTFFNENCLRRSASLFQVRAFLW